VTKDDLLEELDFAVEALQALAAQPELLRDSEIISTIVYSLIPALKSVADRMPEVSMQVIQEVLSA
jgi:hypothetical protein